MGQLGCMVQSSEGGRAAAVHRNGKMKIYGYWRTLLDSMNWMVWQCESEQRNMHGFWRVA